MDVVVSKVTAAMSEIDIDKMTRLQASSLMAMIRKRVHVDGNASDGSPIGNYTKSYKERIRPKHGRKEGYKVVLSLTRAMENGMVLYPIPNGTGIGYLTKELLQKAKWQEKRACYGFRPIWTPTKEEREMVLKIGQNYIEQHLK
jgi:hypothetical protein